MLENEHALEQMGLADYKSQKAVLVQAVEDIRREGRVLQPEAYILMGEILNNSSGVDELLKKITLEEKEGLKLLFEKDWGWIKDFGKGGGIERIFPPNVAADLRKAAKLHLP